MNQENKPKNNFQVTFDFVKTPITQIADYIIIAASKSNSSDIHFDPRENGMMVRFRIDGDLQDYSFIPKAYERNLTTRLKLLANMNITESRLPQDGAIKGMFGDTYLDMRVSCLPLNEGEKIVIRILDYTRSLQGIDSLGFNEKNLIKLKRMMEAPNGIILVTGATGSGKSTTTYSILQGLNKPETNIITVEDPIEMNIQGINQVQVNSEIGMTFAAALRSILRQDPNVILIGEIRDSETAQIAVRSAITGHLVLSTIHTNNSLSTIERLMDMDVERYLLSTALVGIISQRLAKKICPKCRYQRKTTPYEQKIFRTFLKLDVKTIWDANPDGCDSCRKGFKGRIAIQEVLELDDEIRAALTIEGLEKDELKKMVYTDKTITLLQDALLKCLDGQTNFEEVYRVIEMENDDDEDYKSELTAAIKEAREPVVQQTQAGDTYNTYNVNISGTQEQPQAVVQTTEQIAPVETVQSQQQVLDANGQPQLPNIINNLQNVATELANQVQQTQQQIEEQVPVDNTQPTDTVVQSPDETPTQQETTLEENIVQETPVESQVPVDNQQTTDEVVPIIEGTNTQEATPEEVVEIPTTEENIVQETQTESQVPVDNSDTNEVVVPIVEETSTTQEVAPEESVVEVPVVEETTTQVPETVEETVPPKAEDTPQEGVTTVSAEDIKSTLNLPDTVDPLFQTTSEQDDGSIITDDMLQKDVLIGDEGIVEQDNNYEIYDFKNNKTIKYDEFGNEIEQSEEEAPVSDEQRDENDVITIQDAPTEEEPTTTQDVIAIPGMEESQEEKREPIGSDFVDKNGPLLEELPRLGTEIEEDVDAPQKLNTIELPTFTEQ